MARKEYFVLPQMADRPFSSAVTAGDFIFASGTSGTVDTQGKPVESLEAQTRQCLENLKKELELAGASLSDVVKVQVFLAKAEDWAKMNEVYKEFFPVDRPARTAVVTQLIKADMLVEMECIASKP
ncbi:MAG: RidA family protein [Desulfobacteraceae bacterium]|nr:RidA family protein [Desulfobacteraceae bacterium]